MSEVKIKRKSKYKSDGVSNWIKNFLITHILSEGAGEREDSRRRVYAVVAARTFLGCVVSVLFSRAQIAFSMYPLGLAFILSSTRFTPIYSIVVVFTSLFSRDVSSVYAVCALLCLAVRSFWCVYLDTKDEGRCGFPSYTEHIAYRVVCGCGISFILGIYNLIYGSFTYYSLLGSLLVMIFIPLATFVISNSFTLSDSAELKEAARYFLSSMLVMSLLGVTPLSVSLAKIAAFVLTVREARHGKKGAAALMGLVSAIPIGISDCAIFALCGLLAALLYSLSPFVSVIGAYTFTLMAEGYVGGYSALIGYLCELSLGVFLLLSLDKLKIGEKLSALTLARVETRTETAGSIGHAAQSMEKVSDAFASLSRALRALTDKTKRSVVLDSTGICSDVCDIYCQKCNGRGTCWGENASATRDAYAKVATRLSTKARITPDDAPHYLKDNCQKLREVCSEINRRVSITTEKFLGRSGCEILASDYESMSKILETHLKSAQIKDTLDTDLSEKLMSLSRRRMYGISQIKVYGQREKQIFARLIDLPSHTVSASTLREEFESVCGVDLSSPVYTIDGSDIEFEMHTVSAFFVDTAVAALPKENEKVSGDAADTFKNPDGYFYAVICDGMGSGESAAMTSGICREYLHSMLGNSNPKELTIEMLNSVIRENPYECSCTVDMFEFDTYNGNACFIKSGAAPSYVCRGENVYRVEAKTIPIGITEKICAEKIKFRLRDGDIVLMVSDGVAEGKEEGRYVVEQLCKRTTDNPFDIAASVLSAVKSRYNMRDDMTVICATVRKKTRADFDAELS